DGEGRADGARSREPVHGYRSTAGAARRDALPDGRRGTPARGGDRRALPGADLHGRVHRSPSRRAGGAAAEGRRSPAERPLRAPRDERRERPARTRPDEDARFPDGEPARVPAHDALGASPLSSSGGGGPEAFVFTGKSGGPLHHGLFYGRYFRR